jgi:hypothetical protein
MQNTDPLDLARQAFDDWRNKRPHSRSHYPQALRQMALDLLSQYSFRQILAVTGIPRYRLVKWQGASRPEAAQDFIALPSDPSDHDLLQPTSPAPSSLTCAITFPNSTSLTLSGPLSVAQLTALTTCLNSGGDAS